jgi:hypothetical protein
MPADILRTPDAFPTPYSVSLPESLPTPFRASHRSTTGRQVREAKARRVLADGLSGGA